jgi:HAD superfamily hydrolase (TIGR01509 family)
VVTDAADRQPLGAVIFDFDGTLVDTEWPIYERAAAAASALGARLTPELWALHAVGVSMGEPWWDELGVRLGLDIDQATFEAEVASVTHIPTSRDSAEIVEGAAELVRALHAAGVPLAVASGSHREWLEHHLDRFDLRTELPVLVGIDHPSVSAGKPAPDLYLAATAALGVDPATAVAVEDTTRGIGSARAAGMGAVVAITTRLTAHHDLSEADLVVDHLEALDVATLAGLVGAPPA